jgi:carbon monoxide dehydrogenase subunit G
MKVGGTYTFDAPRDQVWEAFLNPEVLSKTLPGCESLEQVGENEFAGIIKVKVGPVQGQFQGTVSLSDLQPPESYKMTINGRGPAGFVNGAGTIQFEAQGEATVASYEGEAQIGGRIASVGQRLMDSTAKSMIRQALENLHKQIQAGEPAKAPSPAKKSSRSSKKTPESAPTPTPPPPQPAAEKAPPVYEAPSQTQFALDVAKDVLDDLIPANQRVTLIGAVVGVLIVFILSEWWMTRLANRVANILEKRR